MWNSLLLNFFIKTSQSWKCFQTLFCQKLNELYLKCKSSSKPNQQKKNLWKPKDVENRLFLTSIKKTRVSNVFTLLILESWSSNKFFKKHTILSSTESSSRSVQMFDSRVEKSFRFQKKLKNTIFIGYFRSSTSRF